MYSTDNGPHYNTWPDGGITPFRSEKNTNWEGAWRVPAFVRWPGKFPAGTVLNGIVSHQDWLPTLLSAAGEPNINRKTSTRIQSGSKNLQSPHRRIRYASLLDGRRQKKARVNSSSTSMTTDNLSPLDTKIGKLVFMEQRAKT